MSLPFKVFTFEPKDASKKIEGSAIIVSIQIYNILDSQKKSHSLLSNMQHAYNEFVYNYKKITWLYQVLQEWWGINETIKNHAQRIANNTGVKTVVPDLYKGKLGLTAEVDKELYKQ